MAKSLIAGGTIVAIATAIVPQQGSVGIVRMSGTEAVNIAKKLFIAPGQQDWSSHRVLYGNIRHPHTGKLIDEALLLLMLAPRSYTREDVVELHCHGGMIVVQEVLQLCIQQGARLAEPGEFTLRAFLNGRIDLTQAESIADLVGAKSQLAAETALAGMQGKLATPIKKLRNQALDILAEIEARIDFEEDLPPLDQPKITADITNMLQELEVILATAEQGELLRTGLKVAIVGRPNVGKSSLLNAWSKTDRAIVTDLPGTTRDVVESQLVVRGIPVQVLDTAGIRETVDLVEKIGVERSRSAAESADLVLFTIDATTGWTADDQLIFDEISQRPVILIINKIDLVTAEQIGAIASNISSIKHSEKISQVVKTAVAINQGIHELEDAIMNIIHNENLQAANLDVAINQRQASALTQAHNALSQCLQTVEDAMPLDFWTIDLRGAIQALGEVTGEEVTESVLDRVFSRFCIGK